jgi:CTP synthase
VATQAHPELKSRPTRPHPLFAGFVKAAVAYSQADQLPVDLDAAATGAPAAKKASRNGIAAAAKAASAS